MIRGKDLKRIGFVEGKALGLALEIVEKEYSALSLGEKLALLKQVLENPSSYINDTKLSPIALELLRPQDDSIALNSNLRRIRFMAPKQLKRCVGTNGNRHEIAGHCRRRVDA